MPRVAALAVLLVAVATACGDDGEVAVEMRTNATSTTFVTLPIPTTTRPPVTQPGSGDAVESGSDGERDDAEEDPNAERSYEVQPGDFVFRIATAHDVTPAALVAYNGWEGLNQHINPGEVIRIPPVNWDPDNPDGDASEPPDSTAPDESAAPGERCPDGSEIETYELRRGDTPGRVAARFDTTVAELEAANAATPNYANFVVGTVIELPC